MFEFITLILFVLLCIGTLRSYFRITWGFAKVAALVLCIVALPVLIWCILLAGGFLLLLPLGLMGLAYCLVRAAT